MRRFSILLMLFSLLWGGIVLAQTPLNRKRVGVVLSGGGAKGTAHVRALKVIEEAGIPIDVVVGTSMGSIVGGLYAAGYTTDQLDSLITSQDWINLLTDAESRDDKKLSDKMVSDKYIVTVGFEKSPLELIEGGVLKGNKIGKLFSDLTVGYHDSIDFQKLPIPFACVSVDIVKNKEIVFKSGILAECMRCSMSIPGVFSPIKKNGMVLVDGGLANNFPVDVAKEMGADVVIGVNVGGKDKSADEINTTLDMLMQILSVMCENKFEENVKMTDVLIDIDVNGYSAASFTNTAIDSLMVRGEKAAREKWDDLLALKETIGLTRPVAKKEPKYIPTDTIITPIPSIYQVTNKNSQLSIGARYDNEELASVLLGGYYELSRKNSTYVGVEARLGKRSYGKLSFSVEPDKKWNFEISYQLSSDETRLNDEGKKAGILDYIEHEGELTIFRSWRQVYLSFGADYRYRHFHDMLSSTKWMHISDLSGTHERSLGYFVSMQYDNRDAKTLPKKGMRWFLQYTFLTDNGVTYKGRAGQHIAEGYWQMALSPTNWLTFVPSISGRMIPEKNALVGNMNAIGGIDTYGHYVPHQLSFAGVNYIEMAPSKLLITGLTGREWLSNNLFLFQVANYGFLGNDLEGFVNTRNIFGVAAGIGYKTAIGPIDFNLNWSNLTDKLNAFVNIGYMF